MKQILFVYHSNYTPSNASSVNNVKTLNALERLGHNPTLVAPHDLSKFKSEVDMELPHHSSPWISIDHKYISRIIYYTYCLELASSHDLVFTRDRWFLEYLQYIPSKFQPPILFEAHSCRSALDTQSTSYSREVTPSEEKQQLSVADRVIALSPEIASDLEDIGVDVDRIVPLAADPSLVPKQSKAELRDRNGIDQEKTVIVYAGSINQIKNDFDLLFDAVDTLQRQSEDFVLYIVGVKNDELRSIADCYKYLDVHLVQQMPHHEVFKYLKMSDVGVVPLKSDHTIPEKYASPMKLFEYLVSDLQVVASDVPAISQQLKKQESVHLYAPGNKNSLVESLIKSRNCQSSTITNEFTYLKRAKQIKSVINRI